ncbi:hypothetical protein ACO2Q3_12340 [Caulobacter sp. KR2-114]|uniref:hypothetical protein n=1 Tax=Caulobacter sp. KR2-114 TaxID=3400912 RepID=UPI003C0DB3EE
MSAFATLPLLLALAVTGVLAFGFLRWQRDRLAPPGQGVSVGADGVIVVPILAAEIRGGMLGGRAHNSLGPKLSLDAQGLAFKVLKTDRWTYDQLTGVRLARGLLGPALEFRTARAHLTVTLRDLATARQVLAALPRAAPLSPEAAALRDHGEI